MHSRLAYVWEGTATLRLILNMFVSVLLWEVHVLFKYALVPSHSVSKVMYFIYQLSNYYVGEILLNLTDISGRKIYGIILYGIDTLERRTV